MGQCPPSRRQKLSTVRAELSQILQVVAAKAEVHGCIELEADHVEPTGEPGDETAVIDTLQALYEAFRKTEVEQRVRPQVDPIACQCVSAGDILDCSGEWLRHRTQRPDAVGGFLSKEVEIPGSRPRHEPAQDEIATPDEDDFLVEPANLEELAEGPQRGLELSPAN